MAPTHEIRLLHVDDDPQIRELSAALFDRVDGGIRVFGEPTARDGLATLDERDVDCVLSDYQMPGMDGIEFLRRVRERHPELPVILFTGKGNEAIASRAIGAGVTDYVRKRTTRDGFVVLANRIRNAVETYRSRRLAAKRLDALEAAAEGVGIVDEDGTYASVNSAYADFYGYETDDLVGEHWSMLYPEPERRRFEAEILPRLFETGRWSGTAVGVGANGERLDERLSIATIAGGGYVCILSESVAGDDRDGRRLPSSRTVSGE